MYFVERKLRRKSKVAALSTGERKARGRFYEKVTVAGMDPVSALYYALGLQHGPIPGARTREDFDRYWDEARLVEVSTKWLASSHHRPYNKLLYPDGPGIKPGKKAVEYLQSKVVQIARGLFAEAFDPTAKAADRVRAQTALLKMPCMGLKQREKLPPIVFPSNLKEIEEAAPRLLNEALQYPKAAHSKLVVNTLQWMLAKANPEVYGEKVQVNHTDRIDMLGILETVRERRRVIEAQRAELEPIPNRSASSGSDVPQLPPGVRVKAREL